MIDMSHEVPTLPVALVRQPSTLSKVGLLLLCIQAATGTWTAYRVSMISAQIEAQAVGAHQKLAIYAGDTASYSSTYVR